MAGEPLLHFLWAEGAAPMNSLRKGERLIRQEVRKGILSYELAKVLIKVRRKQWKAWGGPLPPLNGKSPSLAARVARFFADLVGA